jgi:succinate-acetate transporter protein
MLIFAQELPFFLKSVCFIVLAASFMRGANAFAATMGWTGAIVGSVRVRAASVA